MIYPFKSLAAVTLSLFGMQQSFGQTPESLPEKANFHLFVLAGQSNMAGRGILDEKAQETNPRILALDKDGKWIVAKDPIHWDKEFAAVGLAKSFAEDYLADHPEATIGFIPTACGGSPISVWQEGAFFDQTNSHPYDDAKSRTAIAARDGTIKGLLWHQGESDCHPGLAEVYQEKLAALLDRFRSEIIPADTPIVLGQLGQFSDWGEHQILVDEAIKHVAANTKHATFVSSDGLTANADNIHFNTASLREFGHRYYAAFKKAAEN